MDRQTDRQVYFKELAYMTVKGGKSTAGGAEQLAGARGEFGPEDSVLAESPRRELSLFLSGPQRVG